MDALLSYLSVAENRTMLAWIGAGFSAMATAAWAALKFYLEWKAERVREAGTDTDRTESTKTSGARLHSHDVSVDQSRSSSIDQSSSSNVSVGTGVGIGAGASIHSSRIHVGFGLRALFLVTLIAGILLVALSFFGGRLLAVAAADVEQMKTFELALSCGSKDQHAYQLGNSEADEVLKIVDFLEENQGKPVYVKVNLTKECAACQCAREMPIPEDMEVTESGAMFIDAIPKKERWKLASFMEDSHQVTALGPPFNVSIAIFLPKYVQLPNNGQYLRGEYGTFLRYEGPFVLQYFSGTGYRGGYIEPMAVMTKDSIDQIECIRDASRLSRMQRLLKGCPNPVSQESASTIRQ